MTTQVTTPHRLTAKQLELLPVLGITRTAREMGKPYIATFIWAACEDCGRERWVVQLKGRPATRWCPKCNGLRFATTHSFWAEKNPNWKGGIKLSRNKDYLVRQIPKNSPFVSMSMSNGCVTVHRYVLAKYLGRPLTRDEIVHHINGDKKDNRVENLIIMSRVNHLSLHHKRGTTK